MLIDAGKLRLTPAKREENDAGPVIWSKTVKDNSTIIAWIDALKLKQYITSIEFKTLKPKYPEKKRELEKPGLSLKETDNPVIIMIKTK